MTAAGFLPASEAFACPECGGSDFALQLGGRKSGTVQCQGCGAGFTAPPRGPGRPAIGRPLTVRLPDELRARVAAAARPGEVMADTVRRLLDSATAPRPLPVRGAPADRTA